MPKKAKAVLPWESRFCSASICGKVTEMFHSDGILLLAKAVGAAFHYVEFGIRMDLLFMLESLNNFAANGRVSPAVAKIAGVLGIRIVGKASDAGTLEPTDKCRGEAKSLGTILTHLKESGLKTGKVILAHCLNEPAANTLKDMIETNFPGVTVKIGKTLGLCSFYAEKGGLLVGFEKL